MPKEVVYGDMHGYPQNEPEQPHAEITWAREASYVQIGVIRDGKTDPHQEGLWCSLDRNGINRMIRALRRARDAAFGADA